MPERNFTLAQLERTINTLIDRQLDEPALLDYLNRLANTHGLRFQTVRRAYQSIIKSRGLNEKANTPTAP